VIILPNRPWNLDCDQGQNLRFISPQERNDVGMPIPYSRAVKLRRPQTFANIEPISSVVTNARLCRKTISRDFCLCLFWEEKLTF